jgi:chromosome segregation ATPase
MGFMQKNVNVFLLLLVLTVAAALAGSSVYYQKTFDKLTGNYDTASDNLSHCTADLENYRFNLNKTLSSLSTTSQDIRRYDELYSTKATELQSTQQNLTQRETELQETKLSLAEESSLKKKYQRDYQDQLEITRGLEEQTTLLTAQKAQLEASVINYRSRLDQANTCIDTFLSDYDAGLTAPMKTDIDECKR